MITKPYLFSIYQSRGFKLFELIVFFIGLPSALYFFPPPFVLPILWVLTYIAFVLLRKDTKFDRSVFWRFSTINNHIVLILTRFTLVALLLTFVVYQLAPELLFDLPRQNPVLWLLIIFLYPVLSVFPQELIYRIYFFHRYSCLFQNKPNLLIINALLFGYMHIIFHHWIPIALTTIGGLFFAMTYKRSRSTLLVSLEHSLYGCLIFSIGLGQFFFIGILSHFH